MSWVVKQEEQGQAPVECNDARQCIPERSNDTESRTGGTSVSDMEKAGPKADSVQSNKFYILEGGRVPPLTANGWRWTE